MNRAGKSSCICGQEHAPCEPAPGNRPQIRCVNALRSWVSTGDCCATWTRPNRPASVRTQPAKQGWLGCTHPWGQENKTVNWEDNNKKLGLFNRTSRQYVVDSNKVELITTTIPVSPLLFHLNKVIAMTLVWRKEPTCTRKFLICK